MLWRRDANARDHARSGLGLPASVQGLLGYVQLETTGAYACPGCGAILNDLQATTCSYCGAAFVEVEGRISNRLWKTTDKGETWTIVVRSCPPCGGLVTDPTASECPRCGNQLPPLAATPDPRPSVSITVQMLTENQANKLCRRTQSLVRYLDNPRWPIPPPVPKAIAPLLRSLPDACPSCAGTSFRLGVAQEQWAVLCANCGAKPGVRADPEQQGGGSLLSPGHAD